MNIENLKGIIVPLIIPVDDDENIDESKLRQVVDKVIDGGVGAILAFGSNSEFYMFTDEEMEKCFRIIVEETNNRIPVLFGIGAIRTKHAVKLAKLAEKLGAFGISVLQPMFLKPTYQELYRHYETIANSVHNLPVLIYNNPRVGYAISAELVSELAHKVKNIVGMKDSSGDMTYLSEVIRLTDDIVFKSFTGKDTLIYLGLCLGTYGSVCSTANALPKTVVNIYNKFQQGDYVGSRQAQLDFNPVRLIQNKASFPVATKDFANILGMDIGNPILPNLPSNNKLQKQMKDQIDLLLAEKIK